MVNLGDWIDVKQDPEFYRTVDLDNWEYAIMRAICEAGRASVNKLYGIIAPLIAKPKSANYELTEEQFKKYISGTLTDLKKRGLVVSSKNHWVLVNDNSVEDDRKKLLEIYLKNKTSS